MANRWVQGETISSRELVASDPALAKKITLILDKLARCDSVQFWHDQKLDRSQPFVLFSLAQLADLKSVWSSPKGQRAKHSKFIKVERVEVEQKYVWLSDADSPLQRKLIQLLMGALPELEGSTGFAFQRTRTKAWDVPKWIVDFKIGRRIVSVGSMMPARELIRGTSKHLVVVDEVDGIKLVAFRNDGIQRIVGSLAKLGLYSDEVAKALGHKNGQAGGEPLPNAEGAGHQ